MLRRAILLSAKSRMKSREKSKVKAKSSVPDKEGDLDDDGEVVGEGEIEDGGSGANGKVTGIRTNWSLGAKGKVSGESNEVEEDDSFEEEEGEVSDRGWAQLQQCESFEVFREGREDTLGYGNIGECEDVIDLGSRWGSYATHRSRVSIESKVKVPTASVDGVDACEEEDVM